MRRTALAVAVLLVVGFTGSTPLGAASPAATTVTVTPSTDLVPGQVVHVSGTGFAPNLTIAAAECEAGAVAIANCDTGTAVFPVTDANGAYSVDLAVRPSLFLAASGTTVDCTTAAGACIIGVADTADIPGTGVSAPISFAPLGPPQQGAISVTPDRVDVGAAAAVTATGFAPYANLDIAVCAAGATDDAACGGSQPVSADATGGAEFLLYPPGILYTNDGQAIDCTVDDACAYAAWDARDFATTVATAPVRVNPIVPGTLSVTPSTGLHDGDRVQLSGTGWPGNRSIVFLECDTAARPTGHCMNLDTTVTDAAGTFGKSYTVHTTGEVPAHVDCETGPCWIYAFYFADTVPVIASQPISFDVTTTPVTSHYTADELAAVTQAATTLGLTNEELQHLGSWGLAWVLGITGTGTITPVPDTGPDTITTNWLPSEYTAMTALATAHGTTLAEFQKTAALFVAYILSIS